MCVNKSQFWFNLKLDEKVEQVFLTDNSVVMQNQSKHKLIASKFIQNFNSPNFIKTDFNPQIHVSTVVVWIPIDMAAGQLLDEQPWH